MANTPNQSQSRTQDRAAARQSLQAAGVDVGKLMQIIQNLPWRQALAVIQEIVQAINSGGGAPKAGGAAASPEDLKAHFDAIEMLAACGSACCDHCAP